MTEYKTYGISCMITSNNFMNMASRSQFFHLCLTRHDGTWECG
jgi:hypothetical protein